MADRGRDLKVSILSDASRFNLDGPADELDHLSDAAKDSERGLDRLDAGLADTERELRRLRLEADDAMRALAKFAQAIDGAGREAKSSAQQVDSAFETIARSSRSNLRKIDTDVDHAKKKISEVGDEAHDTAREMFASFTNSGDLADAAQELSANAGALFGPVGLAIGAALSVGIAIFQRAAEEMRAQAEEILGQLLESGGRVTKAMVEQRLGAMKLQILETSKEAEAARINIDDYNLSLAGDPEAIARTTDAIKTRYDEIGRAGEIAIKAGQLPRYLMDEEQALKTLEGRLGTNAAAADLAAAALARLQGASTRAADQADSDAGRYTAIGAKIGGGYAAAIGEATDSVTGAARRVWSAASSEMSKPITPRLDLDTSAFYRKLADARSAAKYAAAERFMP